MLPDVLLVITQMTLILDDLKIPYLIGGSIASSTLGKYRFTNDVDFVVDLREESIVSFVAAMSTDYYVDAETISSALRNRSSFSVLHLGTMVKADLFIKPVGAWSDSAWSRRRLQTIGPPENGIDVYVRTVEDMILQKLRWYQIGREVSDRQWSDVIGMLQVQAKAIDREYLDKWAIVLDIGDLLKRAYREVEIGN